MVEQRTRRVDNSTGFYLQAVVERLVAEGYRIVEVVQLVPWAPRDPEERKPGGLAVATWLVIYEQWEGSPFRLMQIGDVMQVEGQAPSSLTLAFSPVEDGVRIGYNPPPEEVTLPETPPPAPPPKDAKS